MREITSLAHIFLRRFCHQNQENQRILHNDIKLFLEHIHNIQDAATVTAIFTNNPELCNSVTMSIVRQFVSEVQNTRSAEYIEFLKTVVHGSDRNCKQIQVNSFKHWQDLYLDSHFAQLREERGRRVSQDIAYILYHIGLVNVNFCTS